MHACMHVQQNKSRLITTKVFFLNVLVSKVIITTMNTTRHACMYMYQGIEVCFNLLLYIRMHGH